MDETPLLQKFNQGLLDIRETFHKTGRLDDSNAKLDEIVKLLCVEVASIYEPQSNIPSLENILNRHKNSDSFIRDINRILVKASYLDIFCNSAGESLLGSNPRLNLPESEGDIAKKMAQLIVETFNGYLRSPNNLKTFELINESFGHFVRDNFRNNIEDAQYMTTPEVVNFICELAFDEIKHTKNRNIIVCDPSCGVGSFLVQFYKIWVHSKLANKTQVTLLGQDKVDRMARLAKINLLLFAAKKAIIQRGNSLLPGSILDKYYEKCDLILTNPPFGARFRTTELNLHSHQFFPCLNDFIQSTDANLDSELLFMDRYLSLLRPGGSAFVVVPDAIISATGLPKLMRNCLSQQYSVISITELPAVTFAQAGTRTKTCILHFRKEKPHSNSRVFFASAKSLGFEVASRKGVPFKRHEGQNELPKILQSLRSQSGNAKTNSTITHSMDPSCVSTPYAKLSEEPWTPNHHSANRYSTLAMLDEKSLSGGFELVRLRDLVMPTNQYRRSTKLSTDTKCISVLHVGDFGSLNIRELMEYTPKYPGQPCAPGDVLFSKINPRIPRVLVVPNLGFPLSCSTEFEVMRAKEPFSPYEIMLLLLSTYAQSQINSLTSGTSSSHNRIKTEQLLNILLPFPKGRNRPNSSYSQLIKNYQTAHTSLVQANIELHKDWQHINKLLTK